MNGHFNRVRFQKFDFLENLKEKYNSFSIIDFASPSFTE